MAIKTETEKNKIKKLLERSGKTGIETRRLKTELRINRKDDGALPRVEGYAAVFNKDSEDMGFIERIKPGAFKNAIKISDARSLFNHDSNYILGRQSNGTLELKEDKTGLFASTQPPDTQLIRDMVLTPIERGDINQQSFGFTIEADSWEGLDTDKPVRTIEKVRELFDVSAVVYPAYPDTAVGLRSLEAARDAAKDIIPDKKTEIKIVLKRDDGNDLNYVFDSKEIFDEFMIEAVKRSDSQPTLPDDDNLNPGPTTITDEEPTKDDTLDKINAKIARYSA